MATTQDYSKKKLPELKAICKERQIKGYFGKKKKKIIEMIEADDLKVDKNSTLSGDTLMKEVESKQTKKAEKEEIIPLRNEVQSHGFTWEKEIMINVYGLTPKEMKKIKYNCKEDLPRLFNRLDDCSVYVKTSGNKNRVCMGDCLRIYDAVNSGDIIHMVVIHYKQNDELETKKIESIVEFDLTNSGDILFGSLDRSQIEELDKMIKSVPQKKKPTQKEYYDMYSLRDVLQIHSGAIHLDIKCNSTQSRLQCSFNCFQEFIEKNEDRVIEKSYTNEFRGGSITSEIISSRRVFTKKK